MQNNLPSLPQVDSASAINATGLRGTIRTVGTPRYLQEAIACLCLLDHARPRPAGESRMWRCLCARDLPREHASGLVGLLAQSCDEAIAKLDEITGADGTACLACQIVMTVELHGLQIELPPGSHLSSPPA